MDSAAVTAIGFGLVEGGIGGFEEKSGIRKGRRGAGQPDREGDRVRAGLVLDLQTLDAFANLLGALVGVFL